MEHNKDTAPIAAPAALTDEQILAEWDRQWETAQGTISIRKVVCATVRAILAAPPESRQGVASGEQQAGPVAQLLAAAQEALTVIGRIRPEGHGLGTEVRLQRAISAVSPSTEASRCDGTVAKCPNECSAPCSPITSVAPIAAPAALTDERIFEIVAEVLGQPLIVEDLREGFTVHTEPRDWLNFARALLAAQPAAPARADRELAPCIGQCGNAVDADGERICHECRQGAAMSFGDWYEGLSPQCRKVIEAVDPNVASRASSSQGVALSDVEWMELFKAAHRHSFHVFQRKAIAILSRASSSRAEVERLRAIAKEYDECIRHMDAGGDFYAFQGKVLAAAEAPNGETPE